MLLTKVLTASKALLCISFFAGLVKSPGSDAPDSVMRAAEIVHCINEHAEVFGIGVL